MGRLPTQQELGLMSPCLMGAENNLSQRSDTSSKLEQIDVSLRKLLLSLLAAEPQQRMDAEVLKCDCSSDCE